MGTGQAARRPVERAPRNWQRFLWELEAGGRAGSVRILVNPVNEVRIDANRCEYMRIGILDANGREWPANNSRGFRIIMVRIPRCNDVVPECRANVVHVARIVREQCANSVRTVCKIVCEYVRVGVNTRVQSVNALSS